MEYRYSIQWRAHGASQEVQLTMPRCGQGLAMCDYDAIKAAEGLDNIKYALLLRADMSGVNRDKFFLHQILK